MHSEIILVSVGTPPDSSRQEFDKILSTLVPKKNLVENRATQTGQIFDLTEPIFILIRPDPTFNHT